VQLCVRYAKYHGSYAKTEYGRVNFALVDLTGGSADEVELQGDKARPGISSGQTWDTILRSYEHGHLLGAGTGGESDEVSECVCDTVSVELGCLY
jgi:hypothetical protein